MKKKIPAYKSPFFESELSEDERLTLILLREDPRIAAHIQGLLNLYPPIVPVDQRTLQIAVDAYLVLLAAKGNLRESVQVLKRELGSDWIKFFQV